MNIKSRLEQLERQAHTSAGIIGVLDTAKEDNLVYVPTTGEQLAPEHFSRRYPQATLIRIEYDDIPTIQL